MLGLFFYDLLSSADFLKCLMMKCAKNESTEIMLQDIQQQLVLEKNLSGTLSKCQTYGSGPD